MIFYQASRGLFFGALLLLCLLEGADAFAPLYRGRIHVYDTRRTSERRGMPLAASKNGADAAIAACRTAIASTIMGLVLLCSPPQQSHLSSFTAPPAFALEQVVEQQTSSVAAVDPDNLSPEDLVGIPPLPKQEKSALDVLQPATTKAPSSRYSPIDEVWTLIDKYYIDKSFNGQVRLVLSNVLMCCRLQSHQRHLLATL